MIARSRNSNIVRGVFASWLRSSVAKCVRSRLVPLLLLVMFAALAPRALAQVPQRTQYEMELSLDGVTWTNALTVDPAAGETVFVRVLASYVANGGITPLFFNSCRIQPLAAGWSPASGDVLLAFNSTTRIVPNYTSTPPVLGRIFGSTTVTAVVAHQYVFSGVSYLRFAQAEALNHPGTGSTAANNLSGTAGINTTNSTLTPQFPGVLQDIPMFTWGMRFAPGRIGSITFTIPQAGFRISGGTANPPNTRSATWAATASPFTSVEAPTLDTIGATLTFACSTTVTEQPRDAAVCAGQTASFSVAASSLTAMSYQWRKDGNPLQGENASTLVITDVGGDDVGSYDCVISSTCPAVTSASASLNITPAPAVIEHPSPVVVETGDQAELSVSASGAGLAYRWHRNGLPLANDERISGADTQTIVISNSRWSDQGSYSCLIIGECGSVMSDAATLALSSCPPAWASSGGGAIGARWVHAQAYSGVNGGTLVFGGRDGANNALGDTWLKTESEWSNVSISGPSARTDHAMARLGNGRVLLFGGKTSAVVNASALGDTWEWNGVQWNLVATSGPAPRAGHAMCYDSRRDRVVMFGGLDASGAALSDTWEWNGLAWTRVATTGPAARFSHTMAFDPVRAESLLFGGFTSTLAGDTWLWNGTTWRLATGGGVGPRFYASADFDAELGRVLLFGGSTGAQTLEDAYVWTGGAWQPQPFGARPSARWTHAMSYDSAARRMVVTGGAGTGTVRFADSWDASGRPIVTSRPPLALARSAGQSVRLAVVVGGTGPFSYAWWKDGSALADSTVFSGVTTASLTINTTDPSQSGQYTLVISSSCAAVSTEGINLDVYCGADVNHDGGVDGDDLTTFVTMWDTNNLGADFTGDGAVDGDDIIGFFARWDVGC